MGPMVAPLGSSVSTLESRMSLSRKVGHSLPSGKT
jgi:hypothetical protein